MKIVLSFVYISLLIPAGAIISPVFAASENGNILVLACQTAIIADSLYGSGTVSKTGWAKVKLGPHGRLARHMEPHQHSFSKNNTGGNLKIGSAKPLENFNKNDLSKSSNNAIKKQAVKPTDPKTIKKETINKGKSKN